MKTFTVTDEEYRYATQFDIIFVCNECDDTNLFKIEITTASKVMRDRLKTKQEDRGDKWIEDSLDHLRERIAYTNAIYLECVVTES